MQALQVKPPDSPLEGRIRLRVSLTPCQPATEPQIQLTPIFRQCFVKFTFQRTGKRMGLILKDLRFASSDPRGFRPRYLVGLSLGPSSAGLLHMVDKHWHNFQDNNPSSPYDVTVVHVDTNLDAPQQSPATPMLEKYRTRFSHITLISVPITAVLGLDTIDWSSLPPLQTDLEPVAQLRRLLQDLPSVTSRVDLLWLLVRHLLLHEALERGCHALLMGLTTTGMAELTLAETAKGRGYAISCQLSDGPFQITRFVRPPTGIEGGTANTNGGKETVELTFPVYYPMREIHRRELLQYNAASEVAMSELVLNTGPNLSGSVVSHKELSIEDVMSRYFAEVEESYPSIVTNVVRTTEKLNRPTGDACGLCGLPLDGQGDERWKGEIGEDPHETTQQSHAAGLCYGCERSIRG